MRKLALIAATIALALAMAAPALAGGGGGAPCAAFAEGSGVVMLDNCFAGTAHFAQEGQAITVTNDGRLPHTYTAVDGSFDSGTIQPGDSFEITPAEGGVVRVFCKLHGTASGHGMAGVLVLGDPLAAATVPAAVAPTPPGPVVTDELVTALEQQSAALAEFTEQEVALLGRLVSTSSKPAEWPAPLTVVLVVAALAVVGIFAVTRAPGREARATQPRLG